MDVAQVLHMVGGGGGRSYASNSLLQKAVITMTKPTVEQTVADLYSSILPSRQVVADLGCSSGPTALLVAGEIVDFIRETSRGLGRVPPEIHYFLNDLPGNDWNTLFRTYLAQFQDEKLKREEGGERAVVPFYASGMPGSFYSRLFPKESIHFVHSSYCLHFLSQVPRGVDSEEGIPLNKRNIYISQTSPPIVFQSYLKQFQRDFTLFLKLRSEEIVSGGSMVLVFLGRGGTEPLNGECSQLYSLLADALLDMASEAYSTPFLDGCAFIGFRGLIEEAKVDSFNLPFYAPSLEESMAVIQSEGSFDIIRCEAFELNWDPADDLLEGFIVESSKTTGENVANCLRAVLESMLADHFGGAIIDDLFTRFAQNVAIHHSKQKTKNCNLSISLKKKKV